MPNKTYIPAFEARVGDWSYFICQMKYAEAARSIGFAFQMGANKDLSTLLQRSLSKRADDITRYLQRSRQRFLGSLIVAAWGGAPEYIELRMDDSSGVLTGIDQGFGVLVFDGSQNFFVLDGQHRLRAIKDAVMQDPELGSEDICVLLVTHHDTQEGQERTQRLFTNINRNARSTTKGENIALDVDDASAIITRRLLQSHSFLKKTGIVKIFTKPPSPDGSFNLAGGFVGKTEKLALTTMPVLYELTKNLLYDAPPEVRQESTRPTDEALEAAYKSVSRRIDALLDACDDVRNKLENAESARDIRAPKDSEPTGHAFMRPVVQLSVTRVIAQLVDQELISWKDALSSISELDWSIGNAPWLAVFNPDNNRMVTAKENKELLDNLLRVHIAPGSRAEVKRARRDYRNILHSNYPVGENELIQNMRSHP